ncbi:ATP-binding cassette domain-containing protein [Undibacterium flavidum]|uniref:ATP-binding cassette domain-containing protein n=1 Tax=Undibacterium flavidum TaxID=2762297 RepID=A0ABR6Y7I4_9BURK|nr:ATP-binding cassette domain-containing protein [Undibacterium flavidum]MBC3872562.1 ATP-binding cassette domain-containing protein [Undibacterium flavidum]
MSLQLVSSVASTSPVKSDQDLLVIHHLRKSFDDKILLDIKNLHLKTASAYVLTGMNGVGKTILLRILAGLEKPDDCSLDFLGQTHQLSAYPKLMREAIVYVHQHPVMFNMSVAENIAYGLRARGWAKKRIQETTEQALDWAGLSGLRHRMPAGLSGGEKQKIALARAKILQPRLLMLDEPTANLDGAAREQVIALIPSLVAQNSSVVMVCHDKDLINLPQICHYKLRDGRIEDRSDKHSHET